TPPGESSTASDRTEAFGVERLGLGVGQRSQRSDDRFEDAAGQGRVAGQYGTVHVRADHPTRYRAFASVRRPVADAGHDGPEGLDARRELGDGRVVLVAREVGKSTQARSRAGNHLPDGATA